MTGAAAGLVVVGIGEDGWDGLGAAARAALREATTILGSTRQLALLPDDLPAAREAWPSPMQPRVDALAAAIRSGEDLSRWVVLASGDPMLHGVGATLARALARAPGVEDAGHADVDADGDDAFAVNAAMEGADARDTTGSDPARAFPVRVIPAPSAYALACARLGWAQDVTPLVSRVADPAMPVAATLRRAGRAVVYVAGPRGAADLAAALRDDGLGAARIAVMERLGGPTERIVRSTVDTWTGPADPLHLVALDLGPDTEPGARPQDRLASPVPGLPDTLFGGDGQLTRAEVRAVALAALAPRPGERLWDVGAGSGTIAIEWCRAVGGASAVAIEQREDRAQTIRTNAAALGATDLRVVVGAAPSALTGLPTPDAIFIGGGPAVPGLIDACWSALPPHGRLVANAVTIEGEQALLAAQARHGGRLVRLDLAHAEPLGSFTGWKPQRPVVQWSASRPGPSPTDQLPTPAADLPA